MIEFVSYTVYDGDKTAVSVNTDVIPTATVCLIVNGKKIQEAACGKNTLDALFKAFCRIVRRKIDLLVCRTNEKFIDGNLQGQAVVIIRVGKKEKERIETAKDSRKAFLMALIEVVNQI